MRGVSCSGVVIVIAAATGLDIEDSGMEMRSDGCEVESDGLRPQIEVGSLYGSNYKTITPEHSLSAEYLLWLHYTHMARDVAAHIYKGYLINMSPITSWYTLFHRVDPPS